jgi:hypothetical protein
VGEEDTKPKESLLFNFKIPEKICRKIDLGQDPDPDPDVFKSRIRSKIARIRNTAEKIALCALSRILIQRCQ